MRNYSVDYSLTGEDAQVLKMAAGLWNLFKDGKVYLNASYMGETGNLNKEDFVDTNGMYVFVTKETLDNRKDFNYNASENTYSDADEDQVFLGYDFVMKNWDPEIDELANNRIKFRWE